MTRLKTVSLNSLYTLLVFEIWGQTEYDYTGYLIVDSGGKPVGDRNIR